MDTAAVAGIITNDCPYIWTITSMNLNDLRLFVHMVDHGGISAASLRLGIPKQTLSKRLAELERTTGVRLIQRNTRSFKVTDIGKELYVHGAAMLIEAEAAQSVIEGRLSQPSGTVRITASVPTAQSILAPLLPKVASSYPGICMILEASDRFVDIIKEGYDIAVRDHTGALPASDLMQRQVGSDPFWLVAAPAYLGEFHPRQPADLKGRDGLLTHPQNTVWSLHDATGTMEEVSLAARYCANEGAALLAAARAGLGIACLPRSLCAADVASGALIRLLEDWTGGSVTTSLLFPSRRGELPSVRLVADAIVEEVRAARPQE